ncbi:GntR family transcriptional regulator [Streptomyces zagrosensis]|uniref:DNA-binding GntR family transcriptional regulator n=1 Tax=Streptomyces zagrosensis TaxID=1042984 RepID=A0A7W9Q5P4_9ACTN|nr:GntR family transcriptional regulator [Streptomyces zagrosensis]MBB5934015.1 DNA-binding GntR family transcriptional regulator [Streptomyces zagrosensis]
MAPAPTVPAIPPTSPTASTSPSALPAGSDSPHAGSPGPNSPSGGPGESRPAAGATGSAAERVYAHIKYAVLERRYEGGTLLTEGGLADAVGVSRTPVREALLRLEVEGLIKLYPKKGALVLPVSAQEITDVVETRLLVEEHAVRKAVPARAELISRLEELLDQQRAQAATGDLAAVAVSDRSFHAEIVRSAGNQILNRLYDQLRDRQLRMGVAVMHAHPDRVAKAIVEHAEILEALRAGDPDAAVAVVHQHVSWVRNLARGEAR